MDDENIYCYNYALFISKKDNSNITEEDKENLKKNLNLLENDNTLKPKWIDTYNGDIIITCENFNLDEEAIEEFKKSFDAFNFDYKQNVKKIKINIDNVPDFINKYTFVEYLFDEKSKNNIDEEFKNNHIFNIIKKNKKLIIELSEKFYDYLMISKEKEIILCNESYKIYDFLNYCSRCFDYNHETNKCKLKVNLCNKCSEKKDNYHMCPKTFCYKCNSDGKPFNHIINTKLCQTGKEDKKIIIKKRELERNKRFDIYTRNVEMML